MIPSRRSRSGIAVFAAAVVAMATPVFAGDEVRQVDDLAKQTQNPVANLISVPLQNNFNFGIGPEDRTQYVLNIQPVIPVNIGDWNLINRTILPIIYQPNPFASSGGDFGLSDINHTTFLSPAAPGRIIWGVGPTVTLPTAVNDRVGLGNLSFGPSVVALTMPGNFVIGALAKNEWSVAGDSDTPNTNAFLLQYFVNYNFEFQRGFYFTSAPIVTADWQADSGSRWVVPLGGGFGQILRLGAQPINIQTQAFWNAERPDGGADWQLRLQLQFLFPTES